MDEVKQDRRVMKTKKAIRSAFARLLAEKDIDRITVKDIAEAADVNRKTFYHYYDGVYQVADEIEDEIIRAFDGALQGVDYQGAIQAPYVFFEKLTAIINSDIDFYGNLMQSGTRANLNQKLVSLLLPRTMEALRPHAAVSDADLHIAVNYAISGMIAAYGEWFSSDRSVPIEAIAENIGQMTVYGMQRYLKRE